MNNTNTTRIEEKNMKCHRKLTPEEINELNTLLESTIKNNNKTTSSQEDINDLLEYLLAMVSNGKSITYIKSELLNMDMDTVCDIATVGACIRAFMETLVDNCDTTGASMQQQDIEEEEDDNTSTVDSTNVSGPRMKLLKSKIATNALTQSGALGASRIKSIEDKKTTAKPKKTPPAKKNKSTLASSAFQRLATTKKGGSQQQQQQRRQENGRGGKQQKQRMQNRNNKRVVEEDFIAAASPTPNHHHRNHGQRGGGRPGRGDERGDRSGRGDERGRGGGPVRGRDNGGRMGGRGGRDNGGRMSGRGEVRGGGHGRGRSVVINSTTSHHHQSYNKRMKFDNDANIPNSNPQYPQQPTFNTNKSYHRGNKPQPPNQTHAQEAKTMPPSLIATTSPSPLIAASFGTTPILRGGPGRDGGPGRGGGRGRGRHHIPGRTDVKELLASKTWVRKRGMEEELGTKR